MEKRQQDGIDLVVVTDVVDVGVEFVAQAQIQSELGMNAPVILNVTGDVVVVGVGDDEIAIGCPAADGDGEEEIAVVDHTVAVTVLVGEVLDEDEDAAAEDSEIEGGSDALELSAEMEVVLAAGPVDVVVELRTLLPR
jgi:hypothetical protein